MDDDERRWLLGENVTRFATTALEARLLIGATVEEFELTDTGYRVTLALADGRRLKGVLSRDELDRLILGRLPIFDSMD